MEKHDYEKYEILEDTPDKFVFQYRSDILKMIKPMYIGIPTLAAVIVLVIISFNFAIPGSMLYNMMSFVFIAFLVLFPVIVILIYFLHRYSLNDITVETNKSLGKIIFTSNALSRKDTGSILKTFVKRYEFQSIKKIEVSPLAQGTGWRWMSSNYLYRLVIFTGKSFLPVAIYASRVIEDVVALKQKIESIIY
ncbi:MAG: hypothetical protein ACFFCS_27400 [Candidatus Hodarchaeota archaeon]